MNPSPVLLLVLIVTLTSGCQHGGSGALWSRFYSLCEIVRGSEVIVKGRPLAWGGERSVTLGASDNYRVIPVSFARIEALKGEFPERAEVWYPAIEPLANPDLRRMVPDSEFIFMLKSIDGQLVVLSLGSFNLEADGFTNYTNLSSVQESAIRSTIDDKGPCSEEPAE